MRKPKSKSKRKSKWECMLYTYTLKSCPKKILKQIIDQFNTQCKRQLTLQYGKDQLKVADYILVAIRKLGKRLRSGKQRTQLCGFALVQQRDGFIYIDILCSARHYGGILLARAEKLGRQMGKPLAKLSALQHAISFYRMKGYKYLDDACKGGRERKVGVRSDGFRMTKCI